MAWIARDKTGKNPYRLFGFKPSPMKMVSYEGDVREDFTWSLKDPSGPRPRKKSEHYGPLGNHENTEIDPKDCPVELEPGEGPIEVVLSLKVTVSPRLFEGEGI
jgi:hypothetical protein